jgi:hypothetical protein
LIDGTVLLGIHQDTLLSTSPTQLSRSRHLKKLKISQLCTNIQPLFSSNMKGTNHKLEIRYEIGKQLQISHCNVPFQETPTTQRKKLLSIVRNYQMKATKLPTFPCNPHKKLPRKYRQVMPSMRTITFNSQLKMKIQLAALSLHCDHYYNYSQYAITTTIINRSSTVQALPSSFLLCGYLIGCCVITYLLLYYTKNLVGPHHPTSNCEMISVFKRQRMAKLPHHANHKIRPSKTYTAT